MAQAPRTVSRLGSNLSLSPEGYWPITPNPDSVPRAWLVLKEDASAPHFLRGTFVTIYRIILPPPSPTTYVGQSVIDSQNGVLYRFRTRLTQTRRKSVLTVDGANSVEPHMISLTKGGPAVPSAGEALPRGTEVYVIADKLPAPVRYECADGVTRQFEVLKGIRARISGPTSRHGQNKLLPSYTRHQNVTRYILMVTVEEEMMVWTDCPSASSRGHHAFRWPRPEESAAIKLLNGTPKPPQVVSINRSDRDAE